MNNKTVSSYPPEQTPDFYTPQDSESKSAMNLQDKQITMSCKAYCDRTGDYVCDHCGIQWDNDDIPPECKKHDNKQHGRQVLQNLLKRLRA